MGSQLHATTEQAREWMRRNFQHFVTSNYQGRMFKPNHATLKKVLRDRRVPPAVKMHVYAWLLYRRHRGHAN